MQRSDEKIESHKSVLLENFIHLVAPVRGCWIDCTFGAGGYSGALLSSGAEKVLAIDKDPEAYLHFKALKNKFGSKIEFFQESFAELKENQEIELANDIEGIVFDLGVSSMHLDQAERGFSFQKTGRLDMRMSSSGYPSAFEIVNLCSAEVLADILYYYGEEKKAFKIADKIVQERKKVQIKTTTQLANLVRSVVPKNFKVDPATKTFQAIRIAVNDELNELFRALVYSEKKLKVNGILAIVSFHSIEDRLVKNFGRIKSGKISRGSRHSPEVEINLPTLMPIKNKVIKPNIQEIKRNFRARSGKLRLFRKMNSKNAISDDQVYYPKVELGLEG